MPLPDLDILVAVLDEGNLTAAAERLGLPRATLSRRLVKLEEDVGAVLFHRNTRQLVPTDAGMELYRHARPIVDAVLSATEAVRAGDDTPRGLLRVTVPPGVADYFGGLFTKYLATYPQVRVEVVSVTRHVDLVAEGIDVGLRAGALTGATLVSRRLFGGRMVAVASPAYLAQRGEPTTAEDLEHHDCLVGFARGEVPLRSWSTRDGRTIAVTPRLAANDLQLLAHGALAGLGVALLPGMFVGEGIASGALRVVLPDVLGGEAGLWLVYPEKRLMLPRVRAFIDMLVVWVQESEPFGDWPSAPE